ncbi:MAG: 3-oxoacyl-ACP reductase FabG [Elusimicrobia bacterium]|nr:3-oxoacyl-ACP reductase FabG [Elusimicrobiota bacterium]
MKRRVLVTGASRGIGLATALRLAADGFDVAVNYKSSQAAANEALARILAGGGSGSLLPFDVCDRPGTRRALAEDIQRRGVFWGVVCNAGAIADAPFPALTGEQWDIVLRTNLDGFFNVLSPLAMEMVRAKQGGRIVAMSSLSGIAGNRGQVNYSAAKAGIIGAAKALSRELGKRQITVNCVAPGLIETEMIDGLPLDSIVKAIPLHRVGQPEEVAAAVAFLFSQGAAYITGQCISVNGGML